MWEWLFKSPPPLWVWLFGIFSIIALLWLGVDRGWRMLRKPNIVIQDPINKAKEDFIIWWHLPVTNVKRRNKIFAWLRDTDVEHCRIEMRCSKLNVSLGASWGTGIVEGRWSSDKPEIVMDIRIGDIPVYIPVAIKSLFPQLVYVQLNTGETYLPIGSF